MRRMTNPQLIYGETWTTEDRRNVLRLAAMCDGLPSYRVDYDKHGNPLISHGKPHVRASEYLPTGCLAPSLLEADGWASNGGLYGVLTRDDVNGVAWDAVQNGRRERLKFAFRDVNNPYKRSPLISLGSMAYYALFHGYGSVPSSLRCHLVKLGYSGDLHTTPQGGRCSNNSAKH